MESTAAKAATAAPAALGARTLCEAFQITAAERPNEVALRTPGPGVAITYGEYAGRVRRIAGGLAAFGVGRGDTVALMLSNRPEFNLVDTAALHLGAVPFSIYNTSAPEQIEYLFSNAGNRVVVTERAFLPQVQAAIRGGGVAVEQVVLVDAADDATITLAELEEAEPPGFDFEAALAGGRARRHPDADLHLRHHRTAEGRPAHPRKHDRRGARHVRTAPGSRRAGGSSPSCPPPTSRTAGRLTTGARCASASPSPVSLTRGRSSSTCPRCGRPSGARCRGSGRRSRPRSRPRGSSTRACWLRNSGPRSGRSSASTRPSVWSSARRRPRVEVLEYFDALGLPICEVWGMSETFLLRDDQSTGADQDRHLRPTHRRRRAAHRRRRRGAGARPDW